jgi:hypothetical protein
MSVTSDLPGSHTGFPQDLGGFLDESADGTLTITTAPQQGGG